MTNETMQQDKNKQVKLYTIAISVGEASGDLLGAHLMEALQKHCPHLRFVGIGGPRMKALGFDSWYEQEKLAVRGFVEVIKRLPEIWRIRQGLVKRLLREKPDVFIGIDAPDFNLGVAEKLTQAGVATIHYVSPSVWAWRRERVHKIVKQVNKVLCLFPMEPALYQEAGGQAEFVGHPLAQTMPLNADKTAARSQMRLPQDIPIFALMPGSRVSEVEYMLPIFLQMAQLLWQRYPQARFLLPVATVATRQKIEAYLQQEAYQSLPVQLINGHSALVCTASDVVLVTSGTATLEVALCKRPMVISYKIARLTYLYVKNKIKVPHVGLPNILLNKEVVPELLQEHANAEQLMAAMVDWYESPDKVQALEQDFKQLHLLLQKDTATLAAQAVLQACHLPIEKESV